MRARWGHQGCDALDQLQRREGDLLCFGTAPVTGRLAVLFGAALHQGTALFAQPLQRKRWAGAVAQQARQAGTVVGCQTLVSTEKPLCA